MDLRLHFGEAGGTLAPWRARMESEAATVRERIERLVPEAEGHAVDVMVRRSGHTIPETGFGGSCYGAGFVTLELTPENPAFERNLARGEFGATLAHQHHHSLRHAGPGYGPTLGEAIVSEGLADWFGVEVTGTDRPFHTHSVDAIVLADVRTRAEAELGCADYDHFRWFLGGGDLPRWVGYALGWRLVSTLLAMRPNASAASLVAVPAGSILNAAWVRMWDQDTKSPAR